MQEKVNAIIDILKERYADAPCALHYGKDYELMIAVRLSAQCTDARVNLVTPALFAAYPTLEAMAQANAAIGSWRLEDCTLYVTLEPCPMCAGAIINARIPRVYYGARDREMGACGGVLNLFMERFPHRPALVGGILAEECRQVLSEFFRGLRK